MRLHACARTYVHARAHTHLSRADTGVRPHKHARVPTDTCERAHTSACTHVCSRVHKVASEAIADIADPSLTNAAKSTTTNPSWMSGALTPACTETLARIGCHRQLVPDVRGQRLRGSQSQITNKQQSVAMHPTGCNAAKKLFASVDFDPVYRNVAQINLFVALAKENAQVSVVTAMLPSSGCILDWWLATARMNRSLPRSSSPRPRSKSKSTIRSGFPCLLF